MKKLNHPVPSELLTHIGDITVSFALLELTLRQLTWSLIHDHQRIGQIITSELSFRNLCSLIASLYRERYGEDNEYTILMDLIRKANEIEDRRNQVTHSIWGVGDEAKTVTRIKVSAKQKQGFHTQVEEYNEEKLKNLTVEIKVLAHDIQQFLLELIHNGKAVNNPLAQ